MTEEKLELWAVHLYDNESSPLTDTFKDNNGTVYLSARNEYEAMGKAISRLLSDPGYKEIDIGRSFAEIVTLNSGDHQDSQLEIMLKAKQPEPELFLTYKQAEEELGLTEDELAELEEQGKLPLYRFPGNFKGFRRTDVEKLKGEQ